MGDGDADRHHPIVGTLRGRWLSPAGSEAATTASDAPADEGITGTVGTIATASGGKQITVNGLPVYTFAKDTEPGDVNGQGANKVWWVLSATGDRIDKLP